MFFSLPKRKGGGRSSVPTRALGGVAAALPSYAHKRKFSLFHSAYFLY